MKRIFLVHCSKRLTGINSAPGTLERILQRPGSGLSER
jgi:hypothetical protein